MAEATGKQPFKVWRCDKCAHVDLVEWGGGSHRDPYHETRCTGQPTGPFYLISQDEYLDFLLETGA